MEARQDKNAVIKRKECIPMSASALPAALGFFHRERKNIFIQFQIGSNSLFFIFKLVSREKNHSIFHFSERF